MQAKELKVGFLAPKTGIFTQFGIDIQKGLEMHLKEHHQILSEMPVKLIVEDAGQAIQRRH